MCADFNLTDQLRAAYAAMQHLGQGRPILELADELEVSRFVVSRMIKRARDEGLVEMVSHLPEAIDLERSAALAQRYGISSALVTVPPTGGEDAARHAIARAAARLLVEIIDDDDLVGFGPGRTILELSGMLQSLPTCDVVQLTGVAADDPTEHLRALMNLSHVSGGGLFALHAPFVATDPGAVAAITSQPAVATTLGKMDYLDKSVLTIGGWPGSSQLAGQLARGGRLAALLERGVVAEIGCTLLDARGQDVTRPDDCLIGLSTGQQAATRVKVALGGGPGKEDALVATLKSGLVDVVVTDVFAAEVALRS